MPNSSYLNRTMIDGSLMNKKKISNLYISLHDDEVGLYGDNELIDDNYKRQTISLKHITSGSVQNTNIIEFDNMPESEITHFGVWDSERNGEFLLGDRLALPSHSKRGQAPRWRPGQFTYKLG